MLDIERLEKLNRQLRRQHEEMEMLVSQKEKTSAVASYERGKAFAYDDAAEGVLELIAELKREGA